MGKTILNETMLKDALNSNDPKKFQNFISRIINGTTELPKDVFQWLQTLTIVQQEKFLSASKNISKNKNMSIIEFISGLKDFESELFNYIDTLIEFKSEGIHFKVPLDLFLQAPKTRRYVFKKTVQFLEKIDPLLTIKHLIEFEKIECSLLAKLLDALDGNSKSEKHILLKTLLSKVLNIESCQRILETSLLQKLCDENNDMALLLILEILHEKLGKDVLFQKLNTCDNDAPPLLHSLFLDDAYFPKDYFFKLIDFVFLQDDKVIIDLFKNNSSNLSFVKSLSNICCSDSMWYFYDSLLKRSRLSHLIATPTLLSSTIKKHVVTKEQQAKMTDLILNHKEIQDQLKKSRHDLKNVLDRLSENRECIQKVFAIFVYKNNGLALQESFIKQPYSRPIIEYLTVSDTNTLFHFLEVLCSSSEKSSSSTIEEILNLDLPENTNFFEHLIKKCYIDDYVKYLNQAGKEWLKDRTQLSLLIIGLLEKITTENLSKSTIKIQEMFDALIPYGSIETIEKILGFILQKRLVPEFLASVKKSNGWLFTHFPQKHHTREAQISSNNTKLMVLDLFNDYLNDKVLNALFPSKIVLDSNLPDLFNYLLIEPNKLLFSKLSNFPYHKIQDEKIRTTVITYQIKALLTCRDNYSRVHPQDAEEYTQLLDQLRLNLFNNFKQEQIFTCLNSKCYHNQTPNWFALSSQNKQEAWETDPILKYLYDTYKDHPQFLVQLLEFVPVSFDPQNTPPKLKNFYNELFSIAREKNYVIQNAGQFINKGIKEAERYWLKDLRARTSSWEIKMTTDREENPLERIQEHGKYIRQMWNLHGPIIENYIELMVNNSLQEMINFSSVDPYKEPLHSDDRRIKILEKSIKDIEQYLDNIRYLIPNSYLLSKAYTALIDWYQMLMALDPDNLNCVGGSEKVDVWYTRLTQIHLEKNESVHSKILYLPDEFLKYLAEKLTTLMKAPHPSKSSLLLNLIRFVSAFQLIEFARKWQYSIKPLNSSYKEEEFIVDDFDTEFYNQLLLHFNIPANSEFNLTETFQDNIERLDVEVIKSGKEEVDPYPGPSIGAKEQQDDSVMNRNAFFNSNPPELVKKVKLEEQANSTLNIDIERLDVEVIKSGKQEVAPHPGPSIGAKEQQDNSVMNRNAFFDSEPPELVKKVKLEEQANSTLNKEL